MIWLSWLLTFSCARCAPLRESTLSALGTVLAYCESDWLDCEKWSGGYSLEETQNGFLLNATLSVDTNLDQMRIYEDVSWFDDSGEDGGLPRVIALVFEAGYDVRGGEKVPVVITIDASVENTEPFLLTPIRLKKGKAVIQTNWNGVTSSLGYRLTRQIYYKDVRALGPSIYDIVTRSSDGNISLHPIHQTAFLRQAIDGKSAKSLSDLIQFKIDSVLRDYRQKFRNVSVPSKNSDSYFIEKITKETIDLIRSYFRLSMLLLSSILCSAEYHWERAVLLCNSNLESVIYDYTGSDQAAILESDVGWGSPTWIHNAYAIDLEFLEVAEWRTTELPCYKMYQLNEDLPLLLDSWLSSWPSKWLSNIWKQTVTDDDSFFDNREEFEKVFREKTQADETSIRNYWMISQSLKSQIDHLDGTYDQILGICEPIVSADLRNEKFSISSMCASSAEVRSEIQKVLTSVALDIWKCEMHQNRRRH